VTPRNRRHEPEPTDAQIEAIVADAIAMEASSARTEAAPPSSAIVWWRAQMRARQEAARAVERPLTIVHGLAIACSAGLALSLIGTAVAGVRGSTGWLLGVYHSLASAIAPVSAIDFSSSWVMLPMTAILVSLVVASLAAVFILVDE
jgi:CHASE2 domain-containing sensor protein